ncbi:hypothetical protein [Rhodocista pekingensis]|uniref:Uncharacterized protein n=1 Tax=Rhodocista pekingensis TaxID=201185 RepID=A0ABW2L2M1_9PROT
MLIALIRIGAVWTLVFPIGAMIASGLIVGIFSDLPFMNSLARAEVVGYQGALEEFVRSMFFFGLYSVYNRFDLYKFALGAALVYGITEASLVFIVHVPPIRIFFDIFIGGGGAPPLISRLADMACSTFVFIYIVAIRVFVHFCFMAVLVYAFLYKKLVFIPLTIIGHGGLNSALAWLEIADGSLGGILRVHAFAFAFAFSFLAISFFSMQASFMVQIARLRVLLGAKSHRLLRFAH